VPSTAVPTSVEASNPTNQQEVAIEPAAAPTGAESEIPEEASTEDSPSATEEAASNLSPDADDSSANFSQDQAPVDANQEDETNNDSQEPTTEVSLSVDETVDETAESTAESSASGDQEPESPAEPETIAEVSDIETEDGEIELASTFGPPTETDLILETINDEVTDSEAESSEPTEEPSLAADENSIVSFTDANAETAIASSTSSDNI